jgi:hypothetical protein
VTERVGSKNAICGAAAFTGVSIVLLTLLEGDLPLVLNFVLMGLVLYVFSSHNLLTGDLRPSLEVEGNGGLSAVIIVTSLEPSPPRWLVPS